MTKSMTLKVVTSFVLIIAICVLPWTSAYGEPLNLTGDLNVSGDAAIGGTINASTGNFEVVNGGSCAFSGNLAVVGNLTVDGVISGDGSRLTGLILPNDLVQSERVNHGEVWVSVGDGLSGLIIGAYEQFRDIAMSANGKYQTAPFDHGVICQSKDYGETWSVLTLGDVSLNFVAVAVSASGQYQTIVAFNGIHLSSDYGKTWALQTPNENWTDVAMSASGKFQVAIGWGGADTPGLIYYSANYGQNWTVVGNPDEWYRIDISDDGQILTASTSDVTAQIHVSHDAGATWATPLSGYARHVAISSDGKYQTVTSSTGSGFDVRVYTSEDYGSTWGMSLFETRIGDIDMSADGRIQVGLTPYDGVFISLNYGASWAQKMAGQQLGVLAMSGNGDYMTAAYKDIYRSIAGVKFPGDIAVAGAITVNGDNVATTADFSNVARTDQANTFTVGQAVNGDLAVSGTLTATAVSGDGSGLTIPAQGNLSMGAFGL